MSFVWKRPEGRLKSPEQCAQEILEVALARNLDEFAAVLATMCVAQESDFWCPWNAKDPSSHTYPFDSESNDGRSVGYFQQQNGRAGDILPAGDRDNWWGSMASRMNLKRSCNEFLSRLEGNYRDAINNPAMASNRFISNVQGPRGDLRGEYAKHWDRAWQLVRAAAAGGPPPTNGGIVVPDNRPDFNEFPFFLSGNSNARNVANVDLWLLHTQEPPRGSDNRNDAALELRNFLESTKGGANPVSYHYTGSMANDGGTTVVDCVDTDEACWAVGNSNSRSINFCFAGTRSDWSRQEWLDNERGTIAAAAYLFVQDCAKYPKLKPRVIAPNYSAPPGAADHNYCTKFLKDGNNHTDVGPNFPWDVFTADVDRYASNTPPPPPPPAKKFPRDYTDRELLEWMVNQLGDGDPTWPSKGMTLRDKLWSLDKDGA